MLKGKLKKKYKKVNREDIMEKKEDNTVNVGKKKKWR
jgi:hypothetical protein